MKRDLDLVRSILLRCEREEAGRILQAQHFDLDVPVSRLTEHVDIMIEAGLLEGEVFRSHGEDSDFMIRKIGWSGHDFLAAARDATVWKKFLSVAKDKAMPLTLSFALAWLRKEAAERFGISLPSVHE